MTDLALRAAIRARASRSWCLFLDRDGVVNTRIKDGYVRDWTEFSFEPGALSALAGLSRWATRVVVVTNQQGVGKGIMSAADLDDVHEHMRVAVAAAGGRIDAVESCPHLVADRCVCRKPSAAMATRYLAAHHELDGALSVMVGDTTSDVAMGRGIAALTGGGMTVRIDRDIDPCADLTFPSLAAFAAAVDQAAE